MPGTPNPTPHLGLDEVLAMMERARAAGRAATARKSRPVDARPARPGEVVVTEIAGEGRETQSAPASPGDWVVRNRNAATGDEQYLVDARAFTERYALADGPADPGGWRRAVPRGRPVRYFVVSPEQGEFTFEAPWGEAMVARPGDAIVQDPQRPRDTWRVAAAAFEASYERLDSV